MKKCRDCVNWKPLEKNPNMGVCQTPQRTGIYHEKVNGKILEFHYGPYRNKYQKACKRRYIEREKPEGSDV